MFKFRKKPVVIEAFQHQSNAGEMTTAWPRWLLSAIIDGVVTVDESNTTIINTLEGAMKVSEGDWIIQGVAGELYPCKPDIFAATYEPVA